MESVVIFANIEVPPYRLHCIGFFNCLFYQIIDCMNAIDHYCVVYKSRADRTNEFYFSVKGMLYKPFVRI